MGIKVKATMELLIEAQASLQKCQELDKTNSTALEFARACETFGDTIAVLIESLNGGVYIELKHSELSSKLVGEMERVVADVDEIIQSFRD